MVIQKGGNHMTIKELARKYKTDKYSHGYTGYYDSLFSTLRNKKINLLEIGVKDGASLRVWRDYFPNANIFGVDIDPTCTLRGPEEVKYLIGDQSDPKFLLYNVGHKGPFNIIIDDGSHLMDDQILTLCTLFPFLARGGLYVIEDCHTSYQGRYGGGYDRDITALKYTKSLIDCIYHPVHKRCFDEKYDGVIQDILFTYGLVVIRKKL